MYATVAELKAEGVKAENDDILERALQDASNLIDKYTRRWFELRSKELFFDGMASRRGIFFDGDSRSNTIFLPILCFSDLVVTIDGTIESADNYVHYNSVDSEDWKSPRIVFDFVPYAERRGIKVTGQFGFVEADGSTPSLIKKACLLMAINDSAVYSDQDRTDAIERGRIIEEDTDGHSYKLGEGGAGYYTGQAEVDRILTMYKKPLGISSI